MLSQRKITIRASIVPLHCQGSLTAKERSLHTGEAACVSTPSCGPPRLHSPAFRRPSGVNSDTRRPLGTRRNAHLARGQTRKLTIKTGFARKVGRESRGIERGSSLALGPVLIQTLRNNARSSLRAWRSETATHLHPLCSHPQRALLLRTPPLRFLDHFTARHPSLRRQQTKPQHPEPSAAQAARALNARGDHGQERKGHE